MALKLSMGQSSALTCVVVLYRVVLWVLGDVLLLVRISCNISSRWSECRAVVVGAGVLSVQLPRLDRERETLRPRRDVT